MGLLVEGCSVNPGVIHLLRKRRPHPDRPLQEEHHCQLCGEEGHNILTCKYGGTAERMAFYRNKLSNVAREKRSIASAAGHDASAAGQEGSGNVLAGMHTGENAPAAGHDASSTGPDASTQPRLHNILICAYGGPEKPVARAAIPRTSSTSEKAH